MKKSDYVYKLNITILVCIFYFKFLNLIFLSAFKNFSFYYFHLFNTIKSVNNNEILTKCALYCDRAFKNCVLEIHDELLYNSAWKLMHIYNIYMVH